MKTSVRDLPAYGKMVEEFVEKEYSEGVEDDTSIYTWDGKSLVSGGLTPGHYVGAIKYGKIKFTDVPEECRTREFFLHALSGTHEDLVEFAKAHPEKFDKQFFKDHMVTNYYGLMFSLNDFEWMPLEVMDEELVMCAMLRSISMRYIDRRGDCKDWFYSVQRRKPELLTQEMYILGARCFASKICGENKFLEITPEKYRTLEYWYALCIDNDTPVMEDIPDDALTDNFLSGLLRIGPEQIQCFSEAALEREFPLPDVGRMKCWQIAVRMDGHVIRYIPLNDERVKYFMDWYPKDSFEYQHGFKDHYNKYLRKKNGTSAGNRAVEAAGAAMMAGIMSGMDPDAAIGIANDVMHAATDRNSILPIRSRARVPKEYAKTYDTEEYLLEIYRKLGIQVIGETDQYYYSVVLPDGLSIDESRDGTFLKNWSEKLLRICDYGSFYDRSVYVDEIYVTL